MPDEGQKRLKGYIQTSWADESDIVDLPINSPEAGVAVDGIGGTIDVDLEVHTSLLNLAWAVALAVLGPLLTIPGILAFWRDLRKAKQELNEAGNSTQSDNSQIILPNDPRFRR